MAIVIQLNFFKFFKYIYLPDIMLAEGVGNLNCVSRYFGKNVYKPAIGKI